MTQRLRNPLVALPVAAASVAVVCILGLLLLGFPVLGLAGGGDGDDEHAAETEAGPTGRLVEAARVPARRVLSGAFAALPGEWEERGALVGAASVPHPLSCVEVTPALALSRSYALEGSDAQLTLAAYAAGVGADALARLVDEVAECAPTDVQVTRTGGLRLGVEGTRLAVTGPETDYLVVAWRRGDVVGFASGTDAEALTTAASALDEALAPRLRPHCVEERSGREDSRRNAAYSGERFTGATEGLPLSAEAVPPPDIPAEYAAAGVVATDLEARPEEVPEVALPTPPEHPYWPELPAAVPRPEPPAEVKAQTTELDAPQRVPDPDGPGCGWAFTATAEPVFDARTVEADNAEAVRRTREALAADGQRWRTDVLAYWIGLRGYLDQAAAYAAYSAQVDQVAAAWSQIEQAWSAYEIAHAEWQEANEAREELIDAQAEASEGYLADLQQCATWYAEDPDGLDYLLNCPPQEPPVLSEPVPDQQPEPQEPPDPRP